MTKRNCLITGILVILLLLVSACQSTSEEVTAIKIGGAFPMTGPYAYDGKQMEAGAIMAIEEINEAGGVLGRPLELVIYDVEDVSPEKYAAAGSYLVLNQGVDMIHSAWNVLGPDFTEFSKYDVPYLTDTTITTIEMVQEDLDTYWNCIQLGGGERVYANLIFNSLTSLPYEFPNNKMAIIVGNYEWDINMGNMFRELASENGWEVVVDELTEYGTREWRPVMSKVRAENPSLILVEILDPMDLATLMREFLANPTDSLISVNYMAPIKELVELGGSDVDWVTGFTVVPPLPNDPRGYEWEEKFEAKFGWEPPGGVPPLINYEMIYMWAQAVEIAGDPKDYRAVVQAMIDHPYDGLAGIYKINPNNMTVEIGPDFPGGYAVQIQEGRVVPWEEYESEDFILPTWLSEPWNKIE